MMCSVWVREMTRVRSCDEAREGGAEALGICGAFRDTDHTDPTETREPDVIVRKGGDCHKAREHMR